MRIVFFGSSITSSWKNTHVATYRGLLRELDARGHAVTFFERDSEPDAHKRDLPQPKYGRTVFYATLSELKRRYTRQVKDADLVVVGSRVRDAVDLGRWITRIAKGVTAFYDMDTRATLEELERGDAESISRLLIPKYNLYLSLTGGPTLERLEKEFRAPMARELFHSLDPALYYPEATAVKWDLGYAGGAEAEHAAALDRLLLEPARQLPRKKFVVAGPPPSGTEDWPSNVQRRAPCPPRLRRRFYSAQRFTLAVTRSDMLAVGFSPSVGLFEAAACGTPVISDSWPGLDRLFKPRREILIAKSAKDTLAILSDMSEAERRDIGQRARERVLADHTAAHRAAQLERYVTEAVTGHLMA